jgi:hypothetical protein
MSVVSLKEERRAVIKTCSLSVECFYRDRQLQSSESVQCFLPSLLEPQNIPISVPSIATRLVLCISVPREFGWRATFSSDDQS